MVKVAVAGGFSPAAVVLCRWGFLWLLLTAALRLPGFRDMTRAKTPARHDALRAVAVGAVLVGPSYLVYYRAITQTSTIEATVLGTTAPVWTSLLAWLFLRERVDGRQAGSMALGFAGAWLVSIGFALPQMSAGNTSGNLLYLCGVLMECAAGVLLAGIIRRASGVTVLASQVFGAVVSIVALSQLVGHELPLRISGVTPAGIAAVAYLVLVAGLFCFAVWYRLVERTPLSLMVLSLLLQPPLSALLGHFALGEPLTGPLALGTLLVLGALALAATGKPSEPASPRGDHRPESPG